MKSLRRKSCLFIVITVVLITAVLTTQSSFAASGYVTGKSGLGYQGHAVVYKSASTATPITSGGKTAMISKHVYVPYLGKTGNFLKVQWGSSVGYIQDTKGVYTDMYDTSATKLTANKKVTFGTYTGHIAKGVYVVYVNKGTGKIKWAPAYSGPASEEKWWDPYAYLSAL